MISTRQQLVDACHNAGVLVSVDAIWDGQVPSLVRYQCEDPSSLFEAFVAHPDGFPYPDELLILWSTNGESITAFLSEQKKFIRNYLEDGPHDFEVIANSYQEFAGAIVGHAIGMKQPDDEAANELADFFQLRYLPEVRKFVETDPNWEEGIPEFVRSFEQNPP
jgi:hypothetical protein